ncbi:hypothetical protein AXW83_07275 [Bosea sp. PAMC 26642]|nr:hypothetical protein [Bosea sp. PAMC 26642]AMJ60125.1 hypothetical protein AXW83_07275 [Bosea sp. PAMC 26642]
MRQQATDVPTGSADFKDRYVSDCEGEFDLVPSLRQFGDDPSIRAIAKLKPDHARRGSFQRTDVGEVGVVSDEDVALIAGEVPDRTVVGSSGRLELRDMRASRKIVSKKA